MKNPEYLKEKKEKSIKKSKQDIKSGRIYKEKAKLYELDGNKKVPLFDISIKGDKSGWHRAVVATIPDGSYWSISKGTEMVRLDDYDGEFEITLRNNVKLQLSLNDLADIVDTFLAYCHVQGNIINKRFIKTKKRK